MKKAFLLMAAVALLTACDKEQVNPGIIGKWELRNESGGWGVNNNYPAGNGIGYTFSPAGTYNYVRDTLKSSGTYTIKIDSTVDGYELGSIRFKQEMYPEPFRKKADTIYIGTSLADGIVSKYVKIK